jgi:hypothetical protein
MALGLVGLEDAPGTRPEHLSEAIRYRTLDRTYRA